MSLIVHRYMLAIHMQAEHSDTFVPEASCNAAHDPDGRRAKQYAGACAIPCNVMPVRMQRNATSAMRRSMPMPCHAMPCPCIAVSGSQAVGHACMGLYPDTISCLAAPEIFVPSLCRVWSLLLLHARQGFFNSRANIPLYRYRQLRGKLTGFSRYITWTSNHEQAQAHIHHWACQPALRQRTMQMRGLQSVSVFWLVLYTCAQVTPEACFIRSERDSECVHLIAHTCMLTTSPIRIGHHPTRMCATEPGR